jgi:hypothetical protein
MPLYFLNPSMADLTERRARSRRVDKVFRSHGPQAGSFMADVVRSRGMPTETRRAEKDSV